eukprot:TRINITY_DN1564_c0_g1_i5.p1 TRINITY_DN1564_c0_g1~~TRINITY_DN1564_c0_g1_i5.p1  ORF type:complete len:169 (-),score=26.92 TRINITY_DN1564_c0_g1_i5:102-587(-)
MESIAPFNLATISTRDNVNDYSSVSNMNKDGTFVYLGFPEPYDVTTYTLSVAGTVSHTAKNTFTEVAGTMAAITDNGIVITNNMVFPVGTATVSHPVSLEIEGLFPYNGNDIVIASNGSLHYAQVKDAATVTVTAIPDQEIGRAHRLNSSHIPLSRMPSSA